MPLVQKSSYTLGEARDFIAEASPNEDAWAALLDALCNEAIKARIFSDDEDSALVMSTGLGSGTASVAQPLSSAIASNRIDPVQAARRARRVWSLSMMSGVYAGVPSMAGAGARG